MFGLQMQLNVSKEETNQGQPYVNSACVLQLWVASSYHCKKFCVTIRADMAGQVS